MKTVLFTTYMIRFRRLSTLRIPRVLNRSVEINALRLSATPLFTLRPLYIRNEWAVVIGILVLGDRSLLNPITIICTVVVLVFGILAGADYKDLIKK